MIYKFESFNLFSSVLDKINKDVVSFLMKAHIPLRQQPENQKAAMDARAAQAQRHRMEMSRMQTSRTDLVTNSGEQKSNQPVHVEKRVGRNDPCPCGSGKTYTNCHGKEN